MITVEIFVWQYRYCYMSKLGFSCVSRLKLKHSLCINLHDKMIWHLVLFRHQIVRRVETVSTPQQKGINIEI